MPRPCGGAPAKWVGVLLRTKLHVRYLDYTRKVPDFRTGLSGPPRASEHGNRRLCRAELASAVKRSAPQRAPVGEKLRAGLILQGLAERQGRRSRTPGCALGGTQHPPSSPLAPPLQQLRPVRAAPRDGAGGRGGSSGPPTPTPTPHRSAEADTRGRAPVGHCRLAGAHAVCWDGP